jgi:hypothetical protein
MKHRLNTNKSRVSWNYLIYVQSVVEARRVIERHESLGGAPIELGDQSGLVGRQGRRAADAVARRK